MRPHDIIHLAILPTSDRLVKARQTNKIVVVLLALTCLLFFPFDTAHAQTGQKILLVTTDETGNDMGITINDNVIVEFEAHEPEGSTITKYTAKAASPAPAGTFSGYDIVVVSSVFKDIHVDDRKAIGDAVINKSSNVFVFFVDSCGVCSSANANWFLQLIKDNAKTFTPEQGAENTGYKDFPLNTASAYADSFKSKLTSINGSHFKPFTQVPTDFILYKTTTAAFPAGTEKGDAYGLLLPLGEAKGACMFATTDGSSFDGTAYPKNEDKIAPAFYAAAQGGSCFATVETADLSVKMTGSAGSVDVGSTITFTGTVKNEGGPDEATEVEVKVALGSGLTVESPGTSCTEDQGALTCLFAKMPSGDVQTFTFTAKPEVGTDGTTLTTSASVSSATDDPKLGNNSSAVETLVGTGGVASNPGTLEVVSWSEADGAEPDESHSLKHDTTVELILDASGSMDTKLKDQHGDETTRIAVAKDVLTRVVNKDLPDKIPVAFRGFGTEGGCDTKLLAGPAALERDRLTQQINDVKAIGRNTAIGDALSAVQTDLKYQVGPKLILLVSDGDNNCGKDPLTAIEDLADRGIDVHVNIVGFAIGNETVRRKLEKWAEAGGGVYYDATHPEEVDEAIQTALRHPFKVFDQNSTEVANGVIDGKPIELSPGSYTIDVLLGHEIAHLTTHVDAGQPTTIKVLR